jgi:hypothetical protein
VAEQPRGLVVGAGHPVFGVGDAKDDVQGSALGPQAGAGRLRNHGSKVPQAGSGTTPRVPHSPWAAPRFIL